MISEGYTQEYTFTIYSQTLYQLSYARNYTLHMCSTTQCMSKPQCLPCIPKKMNPSWYTCASHIWQCPYTLHYELTIRRYIFYPDSFRQYASLPLKADLLILRIFPGHLCLAGTSCFLHDTPMVECPVILASQTSWRYWNSPSTSCTLLRGSWHLV